MATIIHNHIKIPAIIVSIAKNCHSQFLLQTSQSILLFFIAKDIHHLKYIGKILFGSSRQL